jgi:hypothetical protein
MTVAEPHSRSKPFRNRSEDNRRTQAHLPEFGRSSKAVIFPIISHEVVGLLWRRRVPPAPDGATYLRHLAERHRSYRCHTMLTSHYLLLSGRLIPATVNCSLTRSVCSRKGSQGGAHPEPVACLSARRCSRPNSGNMSRRLLGIRCMDPVFPGLDRCVGRSWRIHRRETAFLSPFLPFRPNSSDNFLGQISHTDTSRHSS